MTWHYNFSKSSAGANNINNLLDALGPQLLKISQMPPHVRRGGTRGRSNTPRHPAQARAGLSAGRSDLRTQGKFAAFDEFCKRLSGLKFSTPTASKRSKRAATSSIQPWPGGSRITSSAGSSRDYGTAYE